jgi:hypothetical protein
VAEIGPALELRAKRVELDVRVDVRQEAVDVTVVERRGQPADGLEVLLRHASSIAPTHPRAASSSAYRRMNASAVSSGTTP